MTLPAGWRFLTPHELAGEDKARLIIGPFGSNLKTSDYRPDGVPLVFVRDIRQGSFRTPRQFVDSAKADELRSHVAIPGDVLITKMGEPPGDAAVYTGSQPAVITADCIRLRPIGDFDPRFVALAMQAPAVKRQVELITSGIAQRKVSLARFRSGLSIPVPPLEEQRQIVDLIEDHLSRLDAAETYLDAARRRDGVLHDQLLSSELASVSFAEVPLGELLIVGLANGKSVPTQDSGFPVLRLTALREGRIDLAERKPGAWTAEEAERFLVQRGDFLISRGNGSLRLVGRGGLVVDEPDPVAYPDTLIRARPAVGKIAPGFLALVWNAPTVRRQIERAARTTAGIYKVNQKDLGAVLVPVPSLADQGRVASAVAASREALGRLSGEVRAASARSAAVRRALLAAAFSGRLTGDREVAGV